MKRIHFDHNVDWQMLILIFLAIFIYVLAYNNWLGLEQEQANFFLTLGGLLNVVGLSKIFWYKYYVRWNSKSIMLRLDSFFGHTLSFSSIKAFEFKDSQLVIQKVKTNKKIVIPTAGIAEEDLQRLKSILERHTKILPV